MIWSTNEPFLRSYVSCPAGNGRIGRPQRTNGRELKHKFCARCSRLKRTSSIPPNRSSVCFEMRCSDGRARTGTPTALWIDNGHLAFYLREMPASNVVSNFCRMAWIDMVWRGLKRRRTNDMGSYNLPWEQEVDGSNPFA